MYKVHQLLNRWRTWFQFKINMQKVSYDCLTLRTGKTYDSLATSLIEYCFLTFNYFKGSASLFIYSQQ